MTPGSMTARTMAAGAMTAGTMTAFTVAVFVVLAAGPAVVIPLRRWHSRRARWRALRSPGGSAANRPAFVRSALDTVRQAPILLPCLTSVLTAAVGLALGGWVLAVVLGVYTTAGTVLLRRWLLRRDQAVARREVVDAVAGLAADLRAGVGTARAMVTAEPAVDRAAIAGAEAGVVAVRVGAAIAVAEASGAPLADVLERLDTHLRAVDRARATAAAEAAGAHASAGLLAVLPVAGVALGAVIGVDPWRVLLRTPIGAGALLLAVGLQLGGLAWATRLAKIEVSA
jgi:tight adherence protein B